MCEFGKKSIIQLKPTAVLLHESDRVASVSVRKSKEVQRWTVVNKTGDIILASSTPLLWHVEIKGTGRPICLFSLAGGCVLDVGKESMYTTMLDVVCAGSVRAQNTSCKTSLMERGSVVENVGADLFAV